MATTMAYSSIQLKPFERPVLIAWARRCIGRAQEVLATAKPAAPAVAWWREMAEKAIEEARQKLGRAEAFTGPARTVAADPDDFGTDRITFSFEGYIWGSCVAAAEAVAWSAADHPGRLGEHGQRETERQWADLTRNIGREG